MSHSARILADLAGKEARITRVRKALADILGDSERPISIPEIASLLAKRGIEPNKTTLYRELRYFVENGIVREIDLGEGRKRYEHEHADDHHHFVCTNCSTIKEVEFAHDFSNQIKKLEQAMKFRVENHALELFGLCAGCK